jgi:hypothetical protein
MVLITAQPAMPRCRLVVRVAAPDDRRWSDPLPNPRPYFPRHQACEPIGQADGATVGLYLPSTAGDWLPARVTQIDGQWRVTPPRRAG